MRNIRLLTVMERMMVSELLKTIFSVLMVLVVIIVSRNFIKILKMAVEGLISNEAILSILGLKMLLASINFLAPAVFVGVLMVIGRMYRDQEMSALSSAGVGVWHIYRAVFKVIVPIGLLAALMSLSVGPWATNKIETIVFEQKKSAGIRAISEGKFSEYSHGKWIFYAEHISVDNKMQNVFVRNMEGLESSIITAKSAELRNVQGNLYIVFLDGERVFGELGKVDHSIESFAEYAMHLEESSEEMASKIEGLPSSAILWHPQSLAEVREIYHRLSVPLSVLVLAFMAVPLAQVSPRGGVYGNMVTAFLIYFSFSNFEKVSGSWLVRGEIPMWLGFWGTYLLAFVVIAFLLIRFYGIAWVMMFIRGKTV
ncbi:MAG: lipopolysaccharide export system permease protein [Methyloprofundus sp.]|nr:MAG: lipopolysaccharide export system permease protein [Methyloprofundus sp.]